MPVQLKKIGCHLRIGKSHTIRLVVDDNTQVDSIDIADDNVGKVTFVPNHFIFGNSNTSGQFSRENDLGGSPTLVRLKTTPTAMLIQGHSEGEKKSKPKSHVAAGDGGLTITVNPPDAGSNPSTVSIPTVISS